MENICKVSLVPAYSYMRIYGQGEKLLKHRDREACEYSATINIACKTDQPWPLFLETKHGTIDAILKPGDMLVYKGIEVHHWRNAFEGEYCIQVFLHYVDVNGPYKEWKYDKRKFIGDPSKEIK